MKDQTSDINKKFAELSKILKEQSEEIKQIKNSLSALIEQTKPKRMGAYLFPGCGYEWMFVQIKLPAEIWMRIKAGEHVKVEGKGWVPEEGVKPDPSNELFCWDFWEFQGGVSKPMSVYMKSPHNECDSEFAYEGVLREEFIEEFEDESILKAIEKTR
jgi:hypothetical protein